MSPCLISGVKCCLFQEISYVLTFNVSRLGLNPNLKDLPGFELAGDDKVFYPAKIMKISLWFLLISIIFTSLMLMANYSSS